MATATANHDYTHQDVAGDVDDFVMPNSRSMELSPEEIVAKNTFKEIPAGPQVVVLHSFVDLPKLEAHNVQLNGAPGVYDAHTIRVKFCLPGDERATTEDYFRMPPGNPAQLDAYFHGVGQNRRGEYKGSGGYEASRFYSFIGALGFDYSPGKSLPAAACRIGNWKGRKVVVTIEAASAWTNDKGEEKMGRCRPKLFSYKRYEGGSAAPGAPGGAGRPNGAPAHPARTAPPAPAVVDDGTDDI
jgi:hypothetical protein